MEQIDWAAMPTDLVEGFLDYHADNPHVYTRLVTMARTLTRLGHTRIGMGMLFENLRYDHMLKTTGYPFKLNNSFRAFYSRLIEAQNPDLEGVFTMRRSVSDGAELA